MGRAFVVEDDAEMGVALQMMLACLGHEMTWVRNGREALKELARNPQVDVLITDILMPEMDGLELLCHLREHCADLPLIAMTGHRDAPFVKAARRFGALQVLVKPFSLMEFAGALEEAMAPAAV